MKTFSFIGSNKNAGKTTAFNYVFREFYQKKIETIVTSIGIKR